MSFEATVYHVMIASPSDVPEHRNVVREVIYEWNAVHADERKQVLLPVGWETHSAPEMSGPPQSVINKQVLDDCDLLVGIFWTRIGTPTAEYASGAVEEIERHIKAGKPAMLYFSEELAAPSVILNKQYKELQKFKKSCQNRGLYEGFTDANQFKDKFRRQLQVIVKQYFSEKKKQEYNSVKQDFAEVISKTSKEILTADEQKLLKEASLDKRGIISRIRVSGGTYIETNGKHIITKQNPREVARWINVLESLALNSYIKSIDFKGQTFEVTALGYETADNIELPTE